jgi:hypothetical protein
MRAAKPVTVILAFLVVCASSVMGVKDPVNPPRIKDVIKLCDKYTKRSVYRPRFLRH